MKILIVDDDVASAKILEGILSSYGRCELATSGAEAVDAFSLAFESNDKFDLVFLDIMMPVLDGHGVLREIRTIEDDAGTQMDKRARVVMVTAVDDPHDVMNAFRNQCDAYLVKPIEKEQVIGQLSKLGLLESEEV